MSDVEMSFEADGPVEELPDGGYLIRGAIITAPEQWAGQVRDVTMKADGGIVLGPNTAPWSESGHRWYRRTTA